MFNCRTPKVPVRVTTTRRAFVERTFDGADTIGVVEPSSWLLIADDGAKITGVDANKSALVDSG